MLEEKCTWDYIECPVESKTHSHLRDVFVLALNIDAFVPLLSI